MNVNMALDPFHWACCCEEDDEEEEAEEVVSLLGMEEEGRDGPQLLLESFKFEVLRLSRVRSTPFSKSTENPLLMRFTGCASD